MKCSLMVPIILTDEPNNGKAPLRQSILEERNTEQSNNSCVRNSLRRIKSWEYETCDSKRTGGDDARETPRGRKTSGRMAQKRDAYAVD